MLSLESVLCVPLAIALTWTPLPAARQTYQEIRASARVDVLAILAGGRSERIYHTAMVGADEARTVVLETSPQKLLELALAVRDDWRMIHGVSGTDAS